MTSSVSWRPQNNKSIYRGRFAPSPSGYLHFGSLITALASFLDAKNNKGIWLLRIEDIDPPREKAGADKVILKALEAYGLHWDEQVLYQSQQTKLYREVLASLHTEKQSYYCQCTRAQIKAHGGIHPTDCRYTQHDEEKSAIRVINRAKINQYTDIIQGDISCDKNLAQEDFIVLRKDGLFAYQLAVVVDDIFQNISHVIRGCDLLEPTARQLSFFQQLNQMPPQYGHIPLAVTEQGYKLSKQNNALAININNPQPSLIAALQFLGQQPPIDMISSSVEEIIQWAINNWQSHNVPKQREISII